LNPNDTTNITVNPLTGDPNMTGTQPASEPAVPVMEPVAPVTGTPSVITPEPAPMAGGVPSASVAIDPTTPVQEPVAPEQPAPEPVAGTENPGGMPPAQMP